MENLVCNACMLRSVCGLAGQIRDQAEAGKMLPDGKQVRLDKEDMEYFLMESKRVAAKFGCKHPGELEDQILRTKEDYGLI